MENKFIKFIDKIKYELIIVLIGSFILLIDIITKAETFEKSYDLIPGIISIFSTKNTGGAWSIFSSHTSAITIVTIIFIAFMLIFNFFFKKKSLLYAISFGMILSGAIGNLIDRLTFGFVRDFIKLEFINFPIFNVADISICVGVFLLIIFVLFVNKSKTISEAE